MQLVTTLDSSHQAPPPFCSLFWSPEDNVCPPASVNPLSTALVPTYVHRTAPSPFPPPGAAAPAIIVIRGPFTLRTSTPSATTTRLVISGESARARPPAP